MSSLRAPAEPVAGVLVAHRPRDLNRIHAPSCSLVIWRRQARVPLAQWLAQSDWTTAPEGRFVSRPSQVAEAFALLCNAPLALTQDVQQLAAHFARVAGCWRIDVRFGPVWRQECPLFHTDQRDLRLICTYCGPATEFLDNAQVDRGGLGKGDNARVRRHGPTRRARPLDVLMMKGDAYPGQPERGIVHRSPAPDRSVPRLRLRIDPVATP